jgi:hypothetical protein
MRQFFDTLLRQLSARWKEPLDIAGTRAFRCDCGRPVYFRNSQCLGCGAALGFAPDLGEVRTLSPGEADPGIFTLGAGEDGPRYRRCANFDSPAGCNWLLAAEAPQHLCVACGLNRTIPNLSDPDNCRYWAAIESAKRSLVSQLLALDLPVKSKVEDPERGLAFDLLRSPPDGPSIMTGHAGGLITLNVEEADDAKREKIKQSLHEPYRTLLGHFRHEIGHYYWDRLVADSAWLEPFRTLFGDERQDYAAAIISNYEQGPPADWGDRHITAYASAHPWEDWAETWAHYLHVTDSLTTALSYGMDTENLPGTIEPFTPEDLFDPEHHDAERFCFFLNAWLELITVLNELARSLGQPDFYPFVLSSAVVRKLHFVHLVVLSAREHAREEAA